MKYFLLIIIHLLFIFSSALSQTNKFGKITNEQWSLKRCDFDSSSNAVILFDVGSVTISGKEDLGNFDHVCQIQVDFFTLIFERHIRIKILNTNGLKAGSFSFILRSIDGKKDNLSFFNGITFNKENGKVIKQKFNSNILKKENLENGSCLITCEFPNIKAGSIIDLKYSFETNIFSEIPEWNFSNEFPILYSEYNLSIPDVFKCKKICPIAKDLNYESYSKRLKYGVSYKLSNGYEFIYSFNVIHEKYSLSNIPVSQKLKETNKLKYLIILI